VLLAAACPALSGEHVVDLGAGVGAAGLALAARTPDIAVTLVEIDPELAALGAENAQLNGWAGRVRSITLDAAAPARAFAAAGLVPDSVARVLMNPPFNDPVRQRTSPDRRRRLAHAAPRETLAAWIRTAARLLRPHGTLTVMFRADGLVDLARLLDSVFGAVVILPVYPKPDQPAIRILVRATKASRAPLALLPGLALNDAAGHPTPQAEAVLRGGATLPLAQS
jgi:tRNA1(Val) A37 N6-methylase TrmN6